ncbi:MAG TPA: 4Fe-4S binding protein [Candidatus Competibacteraceae bacterium]|nr:4Fe-4S binding protein [Candidatus Competibacteraceae bacterium]
MPLPVTNLPRLPRLTRVGHWLRDHRRAILALQWLVVTIYAVLLIGPVLLPLPDETAHLWNHLSVFAQFAFWGIWWPFVLLSMVLLGRVWCGVLCPEGALSEFASRYARNRPIPRWLRWGGWPFVAFAGTTLYGQMVSVYQYPQAALLVLGGSTVAAVGVGLLYTRGKRVWCRYLCPVNGVFALLAKLAPLHFRTEESAWRAAHRHPLQPVDCAPLLPLRQLNSASLCHQCGRCSGHRDAIALAARPPNQEIVDFGDRYQSGWNTVLLLFGMIGIAMGAFQWSASPWFIAVKQALAQWLVEHDILWPLETSAPWWLFTHYPAQNDVFSWLDGALLIAYILTTGAVLGGGVSLVVWLAAYSAGAGDRRGFQHLAQALVPLAGCGLFLGLSALTVTLLRDEGLLLLWVSPLRATLLAGATLWTLWLGWRIGARYTATPARRIAVVALLGGACALIDYGWALLFWLW